MRVNWVKCGSRSERFCPLETVILDEVNTKGVYIIWHNTSAKVIYVGQGDIKDRIVAHRRDPNILAYRGEGLLLVTWASIPDEDERLGVESYLAKLYTPLASSVLPSAPNIQVNLPA